MATELAEPPEGALALLLTRWAGGAHGRSLLHIARSETRAERIARAARSFAPQLDVLLLPPWDCLPYDRASPSCAVMGQRMAVLDRLARPRPSEGRLVVTTIEAVLQLLPPAASCAEMRFRVQTGQALDLLKFWLIRAGYFLDERVDEPGEVAIRGEVVDLFPADGEQAFRLELANGCIGRIRRYDPVDQRTTADAEDLLLGPASEILLPAEVVRSFLHAPDERETGEILLGSPEAPQRADGLEHRLALFYEPLENLFEHLPGAAVVLDPDLEERREAWLAQIADAYEARRFFHRNGGSSRPSDPAPLEPERLYLDEARWQEGLAQHTLITLRPDNAEAEERTAASVPRFAEAVDPAGQLGDYLRARVDAGDRVLLVGPHQAQRARLIRIVQRRAGLEVLLLDSWSQVLGLGPGVVGSVPLELGSGFVLPGLVVIGAGDVGIRADFESARSSRPAVLPAVELRPGDLVIHPEHGLGRLQGLELVEQDETATECLVLEYAAGRKVLVPSVEIGRIRRYGSEAADVALDRLHADDWKKRKAEVEAQLEQAAGKLLALAEQRANTSAPALAPPRAAYRRFVARFPFTETEDQGRAIRATLDDLARGTPPMDRLVCGDVGFGKTEVALRAAAAAALAGKQVALVAPTTVLVRQHLETFRRRFSALGMRVEQLSRLSAGAEARAVRAGIADGSVNLVVGTQALASNKIRFHDLGLVIIDEEQRFGARQKEHLRALRGGVHALTLSATPIPRTLQSALVGLLDVSVIATAPVRRRPVRTFVMPFDPVVLRGALRRERRRGGQSFVVCPRIQDLQPMAEQLGQLEPELDLALAHGRMKGARLDEVMVRFAAGLHDVLLTTDIIESGLDIPNANTMVVWRADRFGLAQLHQLRGRVGRGARQASTYLLTDPETPLAAATEQRLRTLEALEGLGAGLVIGQRDLEMRGSGDLLGTDQAGHIRLIGTELYQRLLSRALRRARGEPAPQDCATELKLGISAAIPAAYVPEPEIRIALYRRLADLEKEADLADVAAELVDRFGPLPPGVDALLTHAEIRLRCSRLGIARLEAGPKAIALEFDNVAQSQRIAGALRGGPFGARSANHRVILSNAIASPEERLHAVRRVLEHIGQWG